MTNTRPGNETSLGAYEVWLLGKDRRGDVRCAHFDGLDRAFADMEQRELHSPGTYEIRQAGQRLDLPGGAGPRSTRPLIRVAVRHDED